MKKKIGLILLIISLSLFLFQSINITGNIIANSQISSSIRIILIILVFVSSLILLASKTSLDAIVIPTDPSDEEDLERTERAIEEYRKKGADYFIISGQKNTNRKFKNSQRANIYKRLRQSGIKPKQMKVEGKSSNTMENLVYTLNLLEKENHPLKVGFVSYPGHLNRIEDFYNKAVKKGIISKKDFQFYRIETDETPEEKKYESSIPRRILHR